MIDAFEGEHDFLSNFYMPAPVTLDPVLSIIPDDRVYKSVEHAYHAYKTLDDLERAYIFSRRTPGGAKYAGSQSAGRITLRDNWEPMLKLDCMLDLLRKKFTLPDLRAELLKTGSEELVECNWWKDRYWGVYKGKGHNHLGKLLMQVREEINATSTSRASITS